MMQLATTTLHAISELFNGHNTGIVGLYYLPLVRFCVPGNPSDYDPCGPVIKISRLMHQFNVKNLPDRIYDFRAIPLACPTNFFKYTAVSVYQNSQWNRIRTQHVFQ
jgi:hypothetical protein